MSLPLGHAAVGLSIAVLLTEKKQLKVKNFHIWLWTIILSGLPDIDFFVYFFIDNSGEAFSYRHKFTHSILFYFIIVALLYRFMPWRSGWLSVVIPLSILISHSVLDSLYKDSPVTFFLPFIDNGYSFNLLPDIKLRGNMSILLQSGTIIQMFLEGVIGMLLLLSAIVVRNSREIKEIKIKK
ncbi:membrane protein containing DUF457, transmembrane [Candidatus Magnetoovum chiemensis]|nr:membrane protein containing DUF457, transmembrane [Candidatus Magnetoovum chiemensis]